VPAVTGAGWRVMPGPLLPPLAPFLMMVLQPVPWQLELPC